MTKLLQEKKSSVNLLTLFAIFTFSLHLLAAIFLLFEGLRIYGLIHKKPLTFVQLVDGKVVSQTDTLEREPEVIRQFVAKTMAATFNWSGTLPAATVEEATNPKTDAGIPVKTLQGLTKKVSTSSWVASFALSEDFRGGFLAQIADMTPLEIFSQNNKQALTGQLVIQRVYPPEKIAPGQWRVGMVANIVQVRRTDNKKLLTPFNKDFLVRTVDSYGHPLSNGLTPLQKAVYSVRAQKLEIYEVSDFCLTNGYDSSSKSQSQRCGDILNSGSFTR
ncbi:hypothetical protein DP113_07855 [Brasilonema octagenarum UFV-E1]|uniref:Uncharacterized protein n=1 Tax=Brasilonema sennae CENA114 TaxID=415709 RepID=A0A856MBU5_9CYAN|nr:hypothetical protein [Brasilonema sennae]QDL07834.1 hypothetical protein DP114_07900 [Brasilonema sennae CENA114]QDL14194.1 hypothetical protein DP113_07855 [Brasilonema octagenarum UFV-E1]